MSEATGPGAIVQNRREALGLTRQDICDSLNLSVRVVEAIETENWSQLPGPAFIRGYLRAYAKLLEIDGDALTGDFDSHGGDGRAQSIRVVGGAEPRKRGVSDLLQRHPGAVLTGAVAVVICGVFVVLMAVWPQKSQTAAPAASSGPSDSAIPRQAGFVATKANADPVKTNADAAPKPNPVAPDTPAVVAAAGANAPSTSIAVQPAVVRTTAKDPSGARRITPTGDDRLSFAFADDCWVEVKDAQGASLYSDLGKSGGTLELIGHAPFHITLGNAPAVTLQFNAERVTLAPHTRNNVGTLVLGQ
ncbi:MAG TPA: RodZ domain-containing protein [Pseudomonadales bacterium]|nr:RodZ domain-containing protein [Pseudomonadales bacterium]